MSRPHGGVRPSHSGHHGRALGGHLPYRPVPPRLLIASVAYFWRYHAGARLRHPRFDYMEALGFAAHSAAADLPKVFWQTCHSSERRCSKSSTVSVPVSILARTSRSHYKLTWRDRWFESGFLHRRVFCEPGVSGGHPLGLALTESQLCSTKIFTKSNHP